MAINYQLKYLSKKNLLINLFKPVSVEHLSKTAAEKVSNLLDFVTSKSDFIIGVKAKLFILEGDLLEISYFSSST